VHSVSVLGKIKCGVSGLHANAEAQSLPDLGCLLVTRVAASTAVSITTVSRPASHRHYHQHHRQQQSQRPGFVHVHWTTRAASHLAANLNRNFTSSSTVYCLCRKQLQGKSTCFPDYYTALPYGRITRYVRLPSFSICYPPFASIAKGEVFGLLYVCLFVNDFSTTRGPIHAIFFMRA